MNKSNYQKFSNRLNGPIFSVVTPFTSDETIDWDALEQYLIYSCNAGAKNFFVMGYNSRFSQLTFDEIKSINAFVTKVVKQINSDSIVIVADPLHCSTTKSVEFCKHAEECGADLISLIFREKFYSEDQVFKHYKICSDSTSIGILVHEMPFISGLGGHTINWPITLLDKLADIPNIVAIKEDAKNDDYSKSLIETVSDRMHIIISGGGKRQWLQFAELGCQSWLNGIGVFEPKLAVNFWKAYQDKDMDIVNQIINEIEVPFFEKGVAVYGWHLMIKAALELRGHFPRCERMPMLAVSDEELKKIKLWFDKLPIDKFLA